MRFSAYQLNHLHLPAAERTANGPTMATFSALPNEILLEIWSHIPQPEDIESFASVSKNVYAISCRILREHRALKHKFSTFNNGGRDSKVSAAGLLREILINPRVALYV